MLCKKTNEAAFLINSFRDVCGLRAASKPLNHSPDSSNLWCVFCEEILSGVAPPIPAGFRIEDAGFDLGEKDNETIGISPACKARTFDESHADLIPILLAAM